MLLPQIEPYKFRYLDANRKGFTIIELIVVIAIISILTSIGLASYQYARLVARDANRKSDIKQYQVALEAYANNNNGKYRTKTSSAATMCNESGALLSNNYMSACPDKIGNVAYEYKYVSNGTSYFLYFSMESKTDKYFVACSNGKTQEITHNSIATATDCPI